MLIDFHTHVFPDKIAERSIAVLVKGIQNIQGADYGTAETLTCRPATLDGLYCNMEENHVDHSVCLPIATKPEQTAHINAFAEQIRNDRVLSFGSLHPTDPNWERILYDLAERGFRGIKLHYQFQLCMIDSPESIRILKKAEEYGLLVVFHAGADIGLPPPIYATPERISHVLTEMAGSHLIAAHLGGWQQWEDVERYLVGTPILFDMAYIRQFLSAEQALRIMRNHGVEKVLFGSDSPWESPQDTLQYLQGIGLTEDELNLICYQNAQRLLPGVWA